MLAQEDGISPPRAAKRLGFSASELRRLLAALGDDPRFDGLALVEAREEPLPSGSRIRLWLTARGRKLCAGSHEGDMLRSGALNDRMLNDGMLNDGVPVAGVRAIDALRIDGSAREKREDWVVEETPIALLYNGKPFVVMMATPTDLEDFALGFALCEGIVEHSDEFRLVDIVRHDQGIVLHAAIPQMRFDALETRQRSLEGRSGCGLCGATSLDVAIRTARRVGIGPRLRGEEIRSGLARLEQAQPLNARSGGAHAAAFVAGERILVREDVGRHNAVDKVVGALYREKPAPALEDGFLAVTSRASYEIVHKAANAGIAVVAAISAPTTLAIAQARAAGVTLIAFARDGRMNVYMAPERLLG
jgi:formate dehydrogenase accessory protein FdhD